MSLISKFNIFNEIENQFVDTIKLFYVPFNGKVLFVTENSDAFKYKSDTKQLTKLEQLCQKDIIKFEYSGYHYMALSANGCVYSWGNNNYGQLGNDSNVNQFEPKLITMLSDYFAIDMCCGDDHSMVLTRDGNVYAFGNNAFGQLGINGNRNQIVPTLVNLNNEFVSVISCGCHHSAALTELGDVFVWGWNKWGQLGIGDADSQRTPIQLIVPRAKKLVCGDSYSLILTCDGDIYFCGSFSPGKAVTNNYPVKSIQYIKFQDIATSIRSNLCVALSESEQCFIFGEYGGNILENLKETDITSIEELFASYEQITYNNIII